MDKLAAFTPLVTDIADFVSEVITFCCHVDNMWDGIIVSSQDECYQVRQVFAQKLHKGLSRLRLPLEYMAICALCAKDPVKERRAHARQCLVKNINVRREYLKQHAAVSGEHT